MSWWFNGDSTVLFLFTQCPACGMSVCNNCWTWVIQESRPTWVSAEMRQQNWWCIEQDIDHLRSKTSLYRLQNYQGRNIYICSSLTDVWGKITIGVTTCLSNLQILLCYAANSRKCMAQMEGNYYFADNLLERTGGIHMLLSLRFTCPKLAFFF